LNVLESRYAAYEKLGNTLAGQLNNLQKSGASITRQKKVMDRLINIFNGLNDISFYNELSINSTFYNKHRQSVLKVKRNIFESLFASRFAQKGLSIDRFNDTAVYFKQSFSRTEQPYWLSLFALGRHAYAHQGNESFNKAVDFFESGAGDCSEFGVCYTGELKKLGFTPKMLNLYYHSAYKYATNQNGHGVVVLKTDNDALLIMDNRGIKEYAAESIPDAVFEYMPQTDYFREFDVERFNNSRQVSDFLLLMSPKVENPNFHKSVVPAR
jgi:hypothetical protein